MVGEEVELNHALEAAGIRPIETDLGEFIIQLAGERPAHIVAPAIHKTREDVSDLFVKHIKSERTVVPEELTAIARRALREMFQKAGVGVSGANFAVAETGTVVTIENEGNIRMCTTVPRVHIALIGIEKLIPRLADLGVFLRLLGRSGTGQKLTTYTSLLTGPRREGEDGPRGNARGDGGQWPHQVAGRPQDARDALLHSLRGVPEYLPGLSQDWRARLRVGL